MSTKVKPFPRFDRLERVVHWCNATLFLVLLLTGASLYAAQRPESWAIKPRAKQTREL